MSTHRFSLDEAYLIPMNERESALTGWFFDKTREQPVKLRVHVGSESYPLETGIPRPDVAALFGPDARLSGFGVSFPTPASPVRVRLSLDSQDDTQTLVSFRHFAGRAQKLIREVRTYHQWLTAKEHEVFGSTDQAAQAVASLPMRPRFSLWLHGVASSEKHHLTRTIESIKHQLYSKYQVVASAPSNEVAALKKLLDAHGIEHYQVVPEDPTEKTGGLDFRNEQMSRSSGDYIIFLKAGDELHSRALAEVAHAISDHPNAKYIYSDEDRITSGGIRMYPVFKPNIDVDLLFSCHYTGHLTAIERGLLQDLGGMPQAERDLEHWELALRALRETGRHGFLHIPKPLYHRRIHGEPLAPLYLDVPSKREPTVGMLARQAARFGIDARVSEGYIANTFRLQFSRGSKRAAIIVRAIDGDFQISQLAPIALASNAIIYQSSGNALHPVAENPFPIARSASEIAAEVLIFINRPIETLNHEFLDELISQALRPECGLATGLILDATRHIAQWGYLLCEGRIADPFSDQPFPNTSYLGQLDLPHSPGGIQDYCFACRKEIALRAGGLGAYDSSETDRFLRHILDCVQELELRIVVSPYAIATLALDRRSPVARVQVTRPDQRVFMNPRLTEYTDLAAVFRGHV